MFNINFARLATFEPSLVGAKSSGHCARSVRSFIERGGLSTVGRPVAACQYTYFLPSIGFQHIATISGKQRQSDWTRSQARVGDISVMNHGQYGHICMWNGISWVSDFRQNNMWPYGGDGTCFLFRYTGEVSGAVDFSGRTGFGDNPEFYSMSYKLAEQPTSTTVRFRGLYNLYRNLSRGYSGNPMTTYDPQGRVVLGDMTTGETGLSNFMFNFIVDKETGKKWGFDMGPKELEGKDLGDAHGHKTYGYGSLYFNRNSFMDQVKPVWSQMELEQLFLSTVKEKVGSVKSWAKHNGVQLSQNQLDSIVSACYNFGNGFLNKKIARLIAQNPNNPDIPDMWSHLSDAQGKKYPGLIKRRQQEAAWYARKS